QPYTFFERDIADDGYDWSMPVGGVKAQPVILDLSGASYKHRWTTPKGDGAAGIVVATYFQGYEIWPNGEGIGQANAAFLETLRAVRPGRKEAVNPVSVAIYKAR